MFADPITVTVNAVPITFNRRSTNGTSANYASADNLWFLQISHQTIRKNNQSYVRSLIKLEQKKLAADPITAVNDYQTVTTQLVEERPDFGFTSTEIKNQLAGFNTFTGTSGNQDKILNQES